MNKKMLLIMPAFYDYKDLLIKELNRQNWDVYWINDTIKLNFGSKIIKKINQKSIYKKFDKYFLQELKKYSSIEFNEILIILGAPYLFENHISLLREYFNNTKIVYYAWDSVANFPNIASLLKTADYSYTFDKEDAKEYNVGFIPLFYTKKCDTYSLNFKYKISVVMSYFPEKGKSVSLVLDATSNICNKYYYLRIKDKILYFKFLLKDRKIMKKIKSYIHFNSLSSDEVNQISSESFAIVDCPLAKQNGLTIRTLESLALCKKLITTNENIKKYDFYTSDNIFVLSENNNTIPKEFFETEFNMDYKLSREYSIERFIEKLTEV